MIWRNPMSESMERNLLHTLCENTLDLIFAKDREGRFIFVNSAIVRMIGAESPEQVLGKTDFDFNPEAVARRYFEDDQAVIRSGLPLVDREEELTDGSTGKKRWHSSIKVPLRDSHGQVIGIIGITRDIHARKTAELSAEKLNNELEMRVAERTAELKALSENVVQSRNLIRTLIDAVPDNLFAKDLQSKFTLANQAVACSMGTTCDALVGKDDFDFFPPAMAQSFYDDDQAVMRTGKPLLNKEEPAVDIATGEIRWLLTSKVPVHNLDGQIIGLVGVGRDISARRQAEQALRESRERFRSLAELSSDWYWEQDKDLRFVQITDVNSKSGYRSSELIGRTLMELPNTSSLAGTWDEYHAAVSALQPFQDVELRHQTADGQVNYLSLSGLPVLDGQGELKGYRGIGRDITERKLADEHVRFLATHDSLTGLPNRVMFSEVLQVSIESARRHGRKLAILFIDLDRFKNINDTLGHEAGDLLLVEMAKRLSYCLRGSDFISRLGGDEFVVLVPEVEDADLIVRVASKILGTAIQPINVMGQECRVTASIGISVFPDDAEDEQTLMKYADKAMYQAKAEGKNNYQFFSADIKARSLERLVLENELRMALDRHQLYLEYQPKRDLKTGEIAGVEALLRWLHPRLGIVSPAQFIPIAEETGLIVLIGRWVLETACHQHMNWQQQGLPAWCMAVNLSARQLFDNQLYNDVQTVLQRTGMKPHMLEMEITEGMVMQDVERAVGILTGIKSLGVRLAIDDFGVGYSSLAQIKRFPIDTLKIDGSFIREIPANVEDKAITEAIIAMGRTLSLTVVAEGVETAEQEAFLREHACDQSQGYYFSRPVSADKFNDFYRSLPNEYPAKKL